MLRHARVPSPRRHHQHHAAATPPPPRCVLLRALRSPLPVLPAPPPLTCAAQYRQQRTMSITETSMYYMRAKPALDPRGGTRARAGSTGRGRGGRGHAHRGHH